MRISDWSSDVCSSDLAKTGPIRADLLGNMWAQEWGNIYPLVAPAGTGDLGYDIGDLLTAQGKTPLDMVKAGENFNSSIGMAPLPEAFWNRRQFIKPATREALCHPLPEEPRGWKECARTG